VTTFLVLNSIVGFGFFIGTVCAEDEKENVLKYDSKQFKREVPKKPHYIFYFSPWCGECKHIAGIWEELGFRLNTETSGVTLAKVDCQAEGDLCAFQDVTDYPSIKFYKPGENVLGVRYRGVEDIQSIEQFLNKNLGNNAQFILGARVAMIPEPEGGLHWLQDENFDEAIGSVTRAFIKFCTPWSSKCTDLVPIWKEVGKNFRFEDDFIFGQVDCSVSKTTCNENEVRGFPSLLWLKDGVVEEKYDSPDRSVEALKKFVMEKLGKEEVRQLPPGYEVEKDATDVTRLNQKRFDEAMEGGKLVFIQFWTAWCSDCLRMDSAWEVLAGRFNDKESPILISTVDCILDKAICEQLKIDDFPTLNIYQKGNLVTTYTGERTVKDMTTFVENTIHPKDKKDEL